jgi:hypothetical protein
MQVFKYTFYKKRITVDFEGTKYSGSTFFSTFFSFSFLVLKLRITFLITMSGRLTI